MKPTLFCLFLLVNAINFCKAQDSTVVMSTSMFDKYYQQGLDLTDRINASIRNAVKEEVSAPAGSMFIIQLPMYQI